jgi:hypothetical protein
MKIKIWMLGLIVIILVFGGIGISSLTGYWQTRSTKIPAKYTSGEFAGEYNPADIRGSYTFGEISQSFQIPLNDLAVAFGIEGNNAAEFQCKGLESLYVDAATGKSVGTNSIRIFVALYKGLPIILSSSDYFLPAAVKILKEKAVLTMEQVTFLDTHVFEQPGSTPSITPTPVSPSATPAPSQSVPVHTVTPGTMTGKTTFQQLLDWGLTEAAIETVIKEKIPAKNLAVRDYASQKGIEFSALKDQLQSLLNALNK